MDIPEWHRELNVHTGHISAYKNITRCKVHTKLQKEWPQGVIAGLLTTSLQTGHRIAMSKARNEASPKSVGSDISSCKFISRSARPGCSIDTVGGKTRFSTPLNYSQIRIAVRYKRNPDIIAMKKITVNVVHPYVP